MKVRRPSHATIVAYMALFVAVGGTAAANSHLLIGGSQIRDHSITRRDLAAGAVTARALGRGVVTQRALGAGVVANLKALAGEIDGSRIKDGSIPAGKLADGAVTDAAVAEGALTGDRIAPGTVSGDRLAAGAVGNAQLSPSATTAIRGWQMVVDTNPQPGLNVEGATATCPAGKQVLGGGIVPNTISTDPALDAAQNDPEFVLYSHPDLNVDGTTGWTATEVWPNGPSHKDYNVSVYALCANTPPRDGLSAP